MSCLCLVYVLSMSVFINNSKKKMCSPKTKLFAVFFFFTSVPFILLYLYIVYLKCVESVFICSKFNIWNSSNIIYEVWRLKKCPESFADFHPYLSASAALSSLGETKLKLKCIWLSSLIPFK